MIASNESQIKNESPTIAPPTPERREVFAKKGAMIRALLLSTVEDETSANSAAAADMFSAPPPCDESRHQNLVSLEKLVKEKVIQAAHVMKDLNTSKLYCSSLLANLSTSASQVATLRTQLSDLSLANSSLKSAKQIVDTELAQLTASHLSKVSFCFLFLMCGRVINPYPSPSTPPPSPQVAEVRQFEEDRGFLLTSREEMQKGYDDEKQLISRLMIENRLSSERIASTVDERVALVEETSSLRKLNSSLEATVEELRSAKEEMGRKATVDKAAIHKLSHALDEKARRVKLLASELSSR